uniref:Cardiac and apoptosis-related long non-coding RNA n=1 Tax=Mus musculus TaxID=10090 RepID=A0A668KLV5_MOUSE
MELFAVTAVAASLFLLLLFLVFISIYVGSNPGPQPLSQNC